MNIDRRTLLVGGGVGVGLVVAFAAWPSRVHSDLPTRRGEQAFGNYIKIARDGRVTVAVPQIETGQGIWTALPQIVADELGAAWETVAVEPAPLTGAYGNPFTDAEGWLADVGRLQALRIAHDGRTRITAGSTSVRAFEEPMRTAAAMARAMLIGAAADRWNVSASECDTGDGFVLSAGRTLTFGELAEEAAARTPPRQPEPRRTAKGRLAGQPLQRLDGPSKANGSVRFAADVRLPRMLFASVRVAPPSGQLRGFSKEAIKGAPGVRNVTARDNWVAVVADSWWAAERALKVSNPIFSGASSAADMRKLFDHALAEGDLREAFRRGDYDSAVEGSRPLTATYFVAPGQHLGLEPLTATARLQNGTLEVWAPTQTPGLAREVAARVAGMSASDVILYPMPVGSPSGRAFEADAIPYAVELANELKVPVQVSLSQSVSQNHDRTSAGTLARLMALPGQSGLTAAWKMQIATANGIGEAVSRLVGNGGSNAAGNALEAAPPYAIPNVAIEAVRPELPYAAGYMRGSPQRELCFFTESFIDELARAAGTEPLAFRMAMLGGDARLARCLQGAARLAQWDGGAPGSTMGIAGCSAFGSHIGLVAMASIDAQQRVKAHRLVAAVDCGRVINSGIVRQQIEGALVWALAQATVPAPEWVAGMPRARPFRDMALPHIGDIPEIVVELIPSSEAPGGVSGLGTTVLAPAIANAIFAGTGKRMRSLPFDPMSVA